MVERTNETIITALPRGNERASCRSGDTSNRYNQPPDHSRLEALRRRHSPPVGKFAGLLRDQTVALTSVKTKDDYPNPSGGLARDADGVLERMARHLGGPEHRDLRSAFAEWVWYSVAPDMGADAALLEPELTRVIELGEVREMKTLVMKSMVDHWLAEGEARGIERGIERVRADQRAQFSRQAGRKFGGRASHRLPALIKGETDPERLAEVGDWIIECDTEAEFLARAGR